MPRRGVPVRVTGVGRTFSLGADEIVALDELDMDVAPGGFTALIGPS